MGNEWIKNEYSRLKGFIAEYMNNNTPEYAKLTLQDGGSLKEGVLEDLGPGAWEEFQISFIDKSK